MIILDTNVLSAIMRPVPELAVARWMDRQSQDSIWITTVTVMEILAGLEQMSAGRRRRELENAFHKLLDDLIHGQVAPFDISAAEHSGRLMARRILKGLSVESRDIMIAGIAEALGATLATRNLPHFADLTVAVVSPWEE